MTDYPSSDDPRPARSDEWPQDYDELFETEDEEWERAQIIRSWLILAAIILLWLLWGFALVFFTQGLNQFDA